MTTQIAVQTPHLRWKISVLLRPLSQDHSPEPYSPEPNQFQTLQQPVGAAEVAAISGAEEAEIVDMEEQEQKGDVSDW